MPKKIITTENAPKAIGPYSQAVQVGNLLYCSGQIPLDPKSGQIAATDIQGQTRQVMSNIEGVLKAAGCNWESVAKTTIFMKSMNDYPVINEIYGSYFKANPPARSAVEVARLPKDVLVEIEVIAVV